MPPCCQLWCTIKEKKLACQPVSRYFNQWGGGRKNFKGQCGPCVAVGLWGQHSPLTLECMCWDRWWHKEFRIFTPSALLRMTCISRRGAWGGPGSARGRNSLTGFAACEIFYLVGYFRRNGGHFKAIPVCVWAQSPVKNASHTSNWINISSVKIIFSTLLQCPCGWFFSFSFTSYGTPVSPLQSQRTHIFHVEKVRNQFWQLMLSKREI